MNKEELIKKLKKVEEENCTEEGHIKADELLLEYINDTEIAAAYEDIPKWYA